MGGVKHNRATLATTSKRLKNLQEELLVDLRKTNTDEFEKGSRVVLTAQKKRLLADANKKSLRLRRRILRPDRSLRQFHTINQGLQQAQTNAEKMWVEEHKNFEHLPDVYEPINALGHASQLGLVQQSIQNFEKSKNRFASGRQQIGKLAAALTPGV